MTQCTSPPALAIYNMNFSPSSKVLPKEEDTTDEVEALPQWPGILNPDNWLSAEEVQFIIDKVEVVVASYKRELTELFRSLNNWKLMLNNYQDQKCFQRDLGTLKALLNTDPAIYLNKYIAWQIQEKFKGREDADYIRAQFNVLIQAVADDTLRQPFEEASKKYKKMTEKPPQPTSQPERLAKL